jgi:hypothetical protein
MRNAEWPCHVSFIEIVSSVICLAKGAPQDDMRWRRAHSGLQGVADEANLWGAPLLGKCRQGIGSISARHDLCHKAR